MERDKLVAYVANLARIEITKEEASFLGEQLEHILKYIDKLKEVNVDGVESLRSMRQGKNVFRQDKVSSFEGRENILANAPALEEGYFKIPKVIE